MIDTASYYGAEGKSIVLQCTVKKDKVTNIYWFTGMFFSLLSFSFFFTSFSFGLLSLWRYGLQSPMSGFVSFRFSSFMFVSFRFVYFRFVSFRFVTSIFILVITSQFLAEYMIPFIIA